MDSTFLPTLTIDSPYTTYWDRDYNTGVHHLLLDYGHMTSPKTHWDRDYAQVLRHCFEDIDHMTNPFISTGLHDPVAHSLKRLDAVGRFPTHHSIYHIIMPIGPIDVMRIDFLMNLYFTYYTFMSLTIIKMYVSNFGLHLSLIM